MNWFVVKLTFLVECIQLVLIVHVMILPSHISERGVTHVTFVDSLRVPAPEMVSQRFCRGEGCLAYVAAVGNPLHCAAAVVCRVFVEFLVFL